MVVREAGEEVRVSGREEGAVHGGEPGFFGADGED